MKKRKKEEGKGGERKKVRRKKGWRKKERERKKDYCIIRVCHIKRRNVSWAGSKCFIAGHMTSDQLASELILKLAKDCVAIG